MPNAPDLWEPGTTLTMCNVPWDATYNDVINWGHDGNGKTTYFDSLTDGLDSIQLLDSTYCKVGVPIQVDVPYTTARLFNYLVVKNPRLPTDTDLLSTSPTTYPATYYYFITGCTQTNPASCSLQIQLDIWTTYYPDFMDLGVGYVEQGHVAMANAPLADASGDQLPYALNRYCSTPEGINVGSEFQTVYERYFSLQASTEYKDLVNSSGEVVDIQAYQGEVKDNLVFIVSTADLTKDPGTIDKPHMYTSQGGKYWGLFSGSSVYAVDASSWGTYSLKLQDASWVSQCIISLTLVPRNIIGDIPLNEKPFLGSDDLKCYEVGATAGGEDTSTFVDSGLLSLRTAIGVGWGNTKMEWMDDRARYDLTPYMNLRKLWAYPYSVFELNGNGQSVFLKPELFGSQTLKLRMIVQGVAPFSSIVLFPENYGTWFRDSVHMRAQNSVGIVTTDAMYGDFLDTALWWTDFPQFSVTNNSYIAYMASTAHTRAYNYDSAEWSLTSSNMGSANSYANSQLNLQNASANALAEMDNTRQNYDISNANQQAAIGNSLAKGIVGVVGSLGSGNIGGAVISGANAALSYVQANRDLNATMQTQANNLALSSLQLSNNQATGYAVANNNLALSRSVAMGNYSNQIAGIDAGIADAALKTPSSSGNAGGAGMRFSNGLYFGYTTRLKRIPPEAICRVGDYFLRFGYTIRRFMPIPDNLVFNNYYSYWKTVQLDIKSAAMNEADKDAFRGIFAKGVTVWDDPNAIGSVIPKENQLDTSKISEYYI